MYPAYKKLKGRMQSSFPRYSDILEYLEVLRSIYPNNVRLEKIGQSTQNRPIYMVIIQHNQLHPKDGIMIESGIHAREWITHTTVLYIIDTILRSKCLLQYMDFYIIPCVNPDGYEYTHTCCRLWRKNLNKNNSRDSSNWGVDLNRNFSCGFGGLGSSENPSNNIYKGIWYFSEPESRTLANTIARYAHRIKLYIALHCFEELIMYPWGYTLEEASDVSDLHQCASTALDSVRRMYPNTRFRVGQLSKMKYLASGTSIDYAKSVHNIKFSFSIELHGKGIGGFVPPTSKILAVAQETFVAINSMIKFVVRYQESLISDKSLSINNKAKPVTTKAPFVSSRSTPITAKPLTP